MRFRESRKEFPYRHSWLGIRRTRDLLGSEFWTRQGANALILHLRRLLQAGVLNVFTMVLVTVYIGYTIAHSHPLLWLLPVSLILVVIIFKNPRIGIYVMLISLFLFDWLSDPFGILPRQLTWTKDLVILILLLRALILMVERKRTLRTPVDVLLGLFVLAGCVSCLINSVPPIVAALGFRHALKYILFFYVFVYSDFEERFLQRLILVILLIAFVQVPIAVVEYSLWRPSLMALGSAMIRPDFVTGTLPRASSGILSLFLVSAMCILIGFGMYCKDIRTRVLMLTPFLFIPLPFAMSRATFLFLPLVALYLLVKNAGHRTILRFFYGMVLFLVFFSIVYLTPYIVKYDIGDWLLDPRFVYMQQAGPPQPGKDLGRITGLRFVADYLKEQPYGLLFGAGPGMWSESYFTSFTGDIWGTFSEYNAPGRNQIARTLSEFGLVGLILYFLLLYKVYRMNQVLFKKVNDTYWKAVSFGFSGIIFLYVLASIYIPLLYWNASAFLFWTLAGTAFTIGRKRGIFR